MIKNLRLYAILLLLQLSWIPLQLNAQTQYCYPKFLNDCTNQYLSLFQVGSYTNTSSCAAKNGIDTSNTVKPVVKLYRGKTYVLRAKASAGGNLGLYFDANGDGDFDDGGETIGTENNAGTYDSMRTALTISRNQKLIKTRVRAITTDAATNTIIVGSGCADFTGTAGTGYGEMEDYLVEITAYKTDAYLVGFADPVNYGCANSKQPIQVIIRNFGLDPISNIPVTVKVTPPGGTTVTLTGTYTTKMASDQTDTFTLKSTVDMSKSGIYKIEAYLGLSGDNDLSNDSLNFELNISPNVNAPKVTNFETCGFSTAYMSATSTTTGSQTFWYSTKTLDSIINVGNTFQTKDTLKHDSVFYAQSEVQYPKMVEVKYYVADRTNTGTFFNIYAKSEVIVDSFLVHLNPGTYNLEVYYFPAGSYEGHETSSQGWVYGGTATVTSNYTGTGTIFPVGGIKIPAGKTYGIFIWNATSSNFRYTAGNTYFGNTDIVVSGATTTGTKFGTGNLTTGRTFDGGVYYHPRACRSSVVSIKARVREGIPGANFKKGSPFDGFFNGGTSFSPDNMCPRDTVTYEVIPPTRFTNSDYGKKWKVSKVELVDASKNKLSDTATFVPTATSNFKIKVFPSVKLANSSVFLKITLFSIEDSCELNLQRQIDVSLLPVANFGFNEVCEGLETTFIDSTDRKGATIFYNWEFGDGGTGTQSYPTHTYPKAGVYDVKLYVSTAAGCYDFITKKVKVYAKPKLGFKTTNLCVGEKVTFTDTTITDGKIIKYYWELGSTKSSLPSPSATFNKPGKYTIKMAIWVNTGCSDTLIREIEIVNKPSASFTFKPGCAGDSSYFVNTSTGDNLNYYWDFGDGVYSTLKNPSKFMYNLNYNVTLTVKAGNSGCVSEYKSTVKPYGFPKAGFSFISSCAGSPVKFVDTSKDVVRRKWTIEKDTFSTVNPSFSFPKAGKYTVKLRVENAGGCADSTTKEVIVTEKPVAAFSVDNGCIGKPVTFMNNSTSTGAAKYEWTFGDGNTSTDKTPSYTYKKAGQYAITLKITEGNCTDIKSGSITISEGPDAKFSASNTGKKANFSPLNKTYTTYIWAFGDGDSSKDVSPTHLYPSATGSYVVTLKVIDAQGCEGSYTDTVDLANSIERMQANLWDIKIYPNPFNGKSTVSYTLQNKSTVKISVIDMEGREIMLLKERTNETAGTHQVIMDGTHLPSGIYFLRMIIGDNVYNTRISKQK